MTTWTTVAAVKTTLAERLAVLPEIAAALVDSTPRYRYDLEGDGSGLSVWVDNDPDVTVEPLTLSASHIRESYVVKVVVQALPANSDDTQLVMETRVSELASAVMGDIYAAWNVAIDLDGWSVRALPGTYQWESGPIADGSGWLARAVILLDVTADRCP